MKRDIGSMTFLMEELWKTDCKGKMNVCVKRVCERVLQIEHKEH